MAGATDGAVVLRLAANDSRAGRRVSAAEAAGVCAAGGDGRSAARSLLASGERHHVNPQRYLTSVLAKIGTTPAEELAPFLPDVWARQDKAEPAPISD